MDTKPAGVATGAAAVATAPTTPPLPPPPLRVAELDLEILPLVYDIVRSVEREPHDNAAKARESHECGVKVLELHAKLESARSQIRRLPGIESNRRDQLERLDSLASQLRLKRELLRKYASVGGVCSFDAPFD